MRVIDDARLSRLGETTLVYDIVADGGDQTWFLLFDPGGLVSMLPLDRIREDPALDVAVRFSAEGSVVLRVKRLPFLPDLFVGSAVQPHGVGPRQDFGSAVLGAHRSEMEEHDHAGARTTVGVP